MMCERAYIMEYPDKDLTVVLVDDGEKQAIMTATSDSTDIHMDDYAKRGYEVVGLRSSLGAARDSQYHGEGWRPRLWHNIESGEPVPAPLGKKWDPAGAFS